VLGCGGGGESRGGVQVDANAAPGAGNTDGQCSVPDEALPEDTSAPTTVVGDGTVASCTPEAFEAAVHAGGVVTFDCGPDPVEIRLGHEVKVFNDAGPSGNGDVTIDGGGKVTLSGGGVNRVLYVNACDEELHWTSTRCDLQTHPRLVVQNLTFRAGRAGPAPDDERWYLGGGGAIFVRSGSLKIVNSVFVDNECVRSGPDVGGGAVYVLMPNAPVYVVNSTFGGAEGQGNLGANGGAVGSIGASWTIINSVLSYNQATGKGGNPAQGGTPGGGSGGAIYNDGMAMTLSLCGTRIQHNQVNAFGSAIFFVSNDENDRGDIIVDRSVITENVGGSWYPNYPQISNHDGTRFTVNDSEIW
jgi:hypothetical protein